MPAATHTVTVDRPVEQVFAFFTDHGNDPQWRPLVKEIDPVGVPAAVGSVIHQVVKGPAGRGIPSDIEVTAYDPSEHYAFKVVKGPVRPVGEFRFVPEGNGTRVSLSLHAELSGVKKVLLSRPVQHSMDGEVSALDRAKDLLERA